MDKIRNSFRKRKTNIVSETGLQEIINNFEENFKEWKEQKNFFNNSKEIDFKKPNASAQMIALKEINKMKIDDLISELRNDLKYNFFSYFWEKKEALNLIIKLKDISKEIDNKIIKQNQELLDLEINKSLIEQEKSQKNNYENNTFFDSKNYLNYLSFFIKEINNDIIYFEEINIKNKKIFLKQLRELNNKIKNNIKKLYEVIEELEIKNNNIFEKIYGEAIMTNLISSFWSFRKKNNDDKYELVENIKKENKTNQNFLYNFELINIIFNKYIEYIIKNEEKIFDNVFVKHNLKKEDLIEEKQELEQNKCKLIEITEKLDKNIISTNTNIKMLKKDVEIKQKNIKDLKNRRKNIKNKNKSCKQDWEENKTNQDNQILIQIDFENKKSKKQYLNLIEEKINKNEKEIKNNKCNVAELEDSLKNDKNQLNIKNERIKKIEKNIIEINLFIKNNDNIMIHELQNIKKKWITKIRVDQKKFSSSLKEINKLKDITFITLIDDFWKIEDNKNIILSLNKKYNVEHNIKNIKEQRKKNIIEMKIDLEKIENEFINKNKEITEIIKIKISQKFQECLEKITSRSKLKNIATQTVINEQNENLNLINSQRLEELEQKLDKNQQEYKILEQKLIEINEIFEEEITELKDENRNTKENLKIYKNNVIANIDKLRKIEKNKKRSENKTILSELNEWEIKLIALTELESELKLDFKENKVNLRKNNQFQINNYNKIDVPSDGSCLFWAISNAYLLPVRSENGDFKRRFINLFGEEKIEIQEEIQESYKNYELEKGLNNDLYKNENVKILITTVFRNKVVNYIKDNLDTNRGENKATFRSAIENTGDQKQNVEEYLNNMKQSSQWGDSIIIEAITNILNCEIIVDNEYFIPDIAQNKTPNEKIKIFHVSNNYEFKFNNHYNFGLNEDVQQTIQLSNNSSNFCQNPKLKSKVAEFTI